MTDTPEDAAATEARASLGDLLRDLKDETGRPIHELTVLSKNNDPFRLDKPSSHRDGRWFRDMMERCGLLGRDRPIHLRGVHYAIVSLGDAAMRPSGEPYKNDEQCWTFLQEYASKAARWLGYVPFEQIVDARNEEPVVRIRDNDEVDRRIEVEDPDHLPTDMTPTAKVSGAVVPQAYRIVLFGEKTSLSDVLEPISERYGTDLYLPSGEISDTLLARMARVGAEDGREMVVITLTDCDPAGYQMSVSIGHKLRAFRETLYPDLRFRLIPTALTVEQVARLALPSTPLKETEKRADGWRARYGVSQTEIDALATLNPNALREIVEEVITPFYDDTLADRVEEAVDDWQQDAQEAFELAAGETRVEALTAVTEERIRLAQQAMRDLADEVASVDFEWPRLDLPEPEVDEFDQPEGLVDSEMDLLEHIRLLRQRKDYSNGEGE